MRDPPRLDVRVQEVKRERHRGDGDWEGGGGGRRAAAEAEGVDAGAVDVVEEEDGEKTERLERKRELAAGVDEEREEDGGAFHEEPGQPWRNCGSPAGTAVAAVWGLDELKGD